MFLVFWIKCDIWKLFETDTQVWIQALRATKRAHNHIPKEDPTLRCCVVKFHKDRVLNKEIHRDFKMDTGFFVTL